MTLPVSSYEELLVQVRELTHETILLQRQLSSDLFNNTNSTDVNYNLALVQKNYEKGKLLTNNVIRHCDKSKEIEEGQNSRVECNNVSFQPRFYHNLEESVRSDELTSQLLAWQHRNSQPITLQENAEAYQDKLYTTESRVPYDSSDIGGEGVVAWGAQTRHPRTVEPLSQPLDSSVAATRTLKSAGDAAATTAAASFNPVDVASTQRCAGAKGAIADAAVSRSWMYPGSLGTETNKEDAMEPETKEEDEQRSSTSSPEFYARRTKRYNEDGSSEEEIKQDISLPSHRLPSSYRGTWPIRRDVWVNQQIGLPVQQSTSLAAHNDVASVMSFSSNSAGLDCNSAELQGHRRLGAKVDVVYNLLGMLETNGREDMSTTLLSMSTSLDSCLVMRQSGCLPLLVQLIHAPRQDTSTRDRAMQALHNVVHAKSDERAGRREVRVLRFLEQLRDYCQTLRISLEKGQLPDDLERHPAATIAALMKLSFDEAHRHAMCQLGGLHAVAELIEMDHRAHGSECDDQNCITLRRYAGMALTNLTFGDGNNKALLCSFREFMKALVSQLRSPSDDLRQVTASVLRNLSWRADSSSKQTLREVGAVTGLMRAAMEGRKESTLKSILSALWNLSAHCSTNKVDICAVDGALAFLVDMLSYKAPSKTLAIIENAGGILRNVSSHIAVRDDYRTIVRERGCLQVLLQQLRSPSLTVVSNACGALWNLSARCPQDQRLLWDLGAVPMLRSLVHSKHKMISMGSSAALKNLLTARPGCNNLVHVDSTARGLGLSTLPTLIARKQKALEQEIDESLAETCDNIEPSTSPTNKDDKFIFKLDHSFLGNINNHNLRSYQSHNQPSTSTAKYNGVVRSESKDSMRSVTSTHSDTMFEKVNRYVLNGMTSTDSQIKQQSSSLHSAIGFENNICGNSHAKTTSSEKKYTLRYKNTIPEHLKLSTGFDINDLRCTNSTISWATVPKQESSQLSLHSSINQSASSSSKGGSQSSILEEADPETKANYQRADIKVTIDSSKCLPVASSMKEENETYNIYAEKMLLCQHGTLSTIPNASSNINPQVNLFGNYAETDLDQPTDYSLRYGEQTTDDEKQHSGFFPSNDEGFSHEDTVRTYYTEGTPRETSLNSSRATSASDLQDEHRIRDSSDKLQEQCNTKYVDHSMKHGKSLSLTDVPKLNDFAESETESNLRCTTHLTDDESGNHSLQYLEEDLDEQAKSAQEETIIQNYSSVRTTPISMDLGVSEYNDHDTEPNSRIINLDTEAELRSQTVLANNCKTNKDFLLSNIEFSSGNTSLKTSNNDSGYQVSDGDEDDEVLLAACINIGMQNNRHRHSFLGNNIEKFPRSESNLTRYQTSLALNQVEHSKNINTNISTSNIKCIESCERTTIENTALYKDVSSGKSKEDMQDNNILISNDKRFEENIQQEATAVVKLHVTDEYNIKQRVNDGLPVMTISNEQSFDQKSIIQTDGVSTDKQVPDISSMKQSYTKDSESSESIDSVEQSEHALLELCIQSGVKSENNININETNQIKNYDKLQIESNNKIDLIKDRNNIEEISEIDGNSNGKPDAITDTIKTSDILYRDNAKKHLKEETYRRQRDPDAMIASLDRLTATLVQQTEAIRERDSSTMKQSVMSDTWNEDSPNDVSFPSISISAPLAASFNSDTQEDQRTNIPENIENNEQINMTESKIIQREAIKLAAAVDAEVNNQNEIEKTSLASIDLETIKPPSSMGSLLSLTMSYAGSVDRNEAFLNRDRCYSTSLPPTQIKNVTVTDPRNVRKKCLPIGMMAKRALGQSQSHTTSLENLLNGGIGSHLENIKPPSMMDELPDMGDMENSMLSVASITSEIADSHSLTGSDPIFEMLKPVANVLSMTCLHYNDTMQNSPNNSLSECLENINPPSLFNEVTEMDESTMEAPTDTMCSDTLCMDMELHTEEIVHSIVTEVIDEAENDTDDAATPISSEYCVSSSAESTPTKRLYKNYLTPKQKRNLTRDRYKTYTIAAEIDKKKEVRHKRDENNDGDNNTQRGKCSPFSKLTPKQRRQEDRARFQTQVLENPFQDLNLNQNNKEEAGHAAENAIEKQKGIASIKSSIPTCTKLPVCRAFKKKRGNSQENKDRYLTRTLNEQEVVVVKNDEYNPTSNINAMEEGQSGIQEYAREDIQAMTEQNATTVMDILKPVESELKRNQRHFINGLSRKLMISTHQFDDVEADFVNEDTQMGEAQVAHEELGSMDPIESDSDEEFNFADEEFKETKRPRIIKPGMSGRDPSADSATDKSEPESPKAIRGRRKPLYSNPITRKTTPQSSPLKQTNPINGMPIGRSNTSPIVRATRATTLRQNSNTSTVVTKDSSKSNTNSKIPSSMNAEKRTRNLTVMSKRASVPQKGSILTFTKSTKRHSTPPACTSNFQSESRMPEVPIKLLERQGTFTKDEPEMENAPTVHSASASPVRTRIAKPIRSISSKVHPVATKSKIALKTQQVYQSKVTKVNSSEKMPSSKGIPTLMALKKVPSGKVVASTKIINGGDANASQNDNGKNSRKTSPLEQRSNSNASIISSSSTSMQNRKLTKDATSKIASLWKKVEESKNRQRFEKSDTRQWIKPANSTTEVDVPNKPFRLFRSSTFEGISQDDDSGETSSYKSKTQRAPILNMQASEIRYRNSCDLTGMNASETCCKIPVKSSDCVSYKKETIQRSDAAVALRKQQSIEFCVEAEEDPTKRLSRLGSFIRMDPSMENAGQMCTSTNGVRIPASAIVPPFNYNPKPDIPSQIAKVKSNEGQNRFETTDSHGEIVTGSARVTTV